MPPSYSPCPRPILKRSSAQSSYSSSPPTPQDEPSALLAIDPSILSPLVRFPPHTALASTLGSAIPYDRTPIVVTPNRCALPERGCPGRTYIPDESPSLHRKSKRASLSPARGKHLHPSRVPGADRDIPDESNDLTPRQSPRVDHFPALPVPPLIPDLSSESSEESDGIASPPPELYSSSASHSSKMSLEQSLMNLSIAGTNAPSSSALSFLPHPPSPRVRPSTSPTQPPAMPGSSSYPYSYSAYASNPNATSSMSSSSNNQHGHGSTSPVRSRSPASPTRSKRKSRPAPIPIPTTTPATPTTAYPLTSSCSPTPTASYPGAPASPERERRSRHRDLTSDRDRERREHRERSRERRERERAERVARYRGLSFGDASCRMSSSAAVGGFGLGVEDSGCLGGF